MLCRGAEVKIRVNERISVQAPESMQESKLFARRPQGLDEKFVKTIIRLLLRCESLQHQHQSVHVSRHLMG